MKDEYRTLTFLLGIRKTSKGLTASRVLNKYLPDRAEDNERFVEVTLEIPESLWAFRQVKGRLESRLEEEFVAFLSEVRDEIKEEDSDAR